MNHQSLSARMANGIFFALALGAGFSVAAIYYSQPLLPLMGSDLHLTINGMGLVPSSPRPVTRSAFSFCCRWATVTIAVA